eukprot:m.158351 g.158351  ORF g.158351 m.158351 type:complete len:71 (+) comp15169_c2_seq9:86-298(+)
MGETSDLAAHSGVPELAAVMEGSTARALLGGRAVRCFGTQAALSFKGCDCTGALLAGPNRRLVTQLGATG